ncbi:hypothetical protein H257_11250 [Aphanomyces astaci]|uniref:U-box domain-containing protein n=1 Tax=Aphanomyces astaci TaxID=112090 RepID=W4G3R2_APHAT|nr:hypothetical protein H257_11250 [Aphanomyces astaci]ETV73926.1 hypothetical protein H257_11250 [Aphanomyces astaci]|eukprot:XP_009836439.1 hypothetical protein H257_11250 [Aphanomyces astaci]
MGGGISTNGDLSQMIACTMLIGEAMFQGLDPRYVRFPDMYRLYDFHVGKTKFRTYKPGGTTYVVFNADGSSGVIDRVTGAPPPEAEDPPRANDVIDENDTSKYLVVNVGDDRVVLDLATINTPNKDGWTPLHASCHTLNAVDAGKAILKAILAQDPSADLNVKTSRGPGSFSSGYTPLHIACAYGMEALVVKLIKASADVHVTNDVHWSPLHEACHRGYTSIVKELLRAGAKHDVACPEFALCPFPGQTPLGEAARQGHLDTVKLLLDHGADKDGTNAIHWTALHEAAYHNRSDVVRMLVVYGADVLIKTHRGAKASDLTISCEIKTMLDDMASHANDDDKASRTQVPTTNNNHAVNSNPGDSSSPPKAKGGSPGKIKGDSSTSPSRSSEADGGGGVKVGPLSRKEDFALLGDLPALQRLHVPAEADQVKDGGKAHKPKKSSKRKQSKEEAVPAEFKCAITHKLLVDPVKSPYGHVFERSVIEKWIQDYGHRCPISGEPLGLAQLTPQVQLKDDIASWNAPPLVMGTASPKKDAQAKAEGASRMNSDVKGDDDVKGNGGDENTPALDDDDLYAF